MRTPGLTAAAAVSRPGERYSPAGGCKKVCECKGRDYWCREEPVWGHPELCQKTHIAGTCKWIPPYCKTKCVLGHWQPQ